MSTHNLTLRFYDGARKPLAGPRIMVSVSDGRGKRVDWGRIVKDREVLNLSVTGDPIAGRFTINASAKGYRDAGVVGYAPVADRELHLMLVGRKAEPGFPPELWPHGWPAPGFDRHSLISAVEENGLQRTSAACLLNILEAMRLLPNSANLLGAITKVELTQGTEASRAQRKTALLGDRALLRVRREFCSLLMQTGVFEKVSARSHGPLKPGEKVASFKEQRFANANLQFTLFYPPGDGDAYADIDMDYFRDPLSHGLMEWFPNTVFGTRTQAAKIYVLRWMASMNENAAAEFKPPWALV